MWRRLIYQVRATPLWAKIVFGLVLIVVLVTLAVDLTDSGSENGSGNAEGSASSSIEEQVKAEAEADADSVSDPNFIGEKQIDVTCAGSLCKASLSSDRLELPLASDVYANGQIQPVDGESRIITYLQNDAEKDCTGAVADSNDLRKVIPCLPTSP